MKDVLVGIGISVGVFLVVVLINLISGYVKSLIESKKQEAIANENIAMERACDTAIKIIDTITTATVATIEQQTAKDLRQAVKDGTADRQKLLDLSTQAYYQILKQVKPEIIETLQENIGDCETYLRNRIEQAVLEVKQKSAMPDLETMEAAE